MKTEITKADALELRNLLIERVNSVVKDSPVALAMSGGIDSMTIFFSLLELEIPFECFIFYQYGIESEDLLSSRNYCKIFNIKLNEIPIPSDLPTVYKDIQRTIPFCGSKVKKTSVETLKPLMYLFENCPYKQILNGSGGDDVQPMKRHISIAYKEFGEEYVKQFRVLEDSIPGKYDMLSRGVASFYGKEFINIYADQRIEDFYMQFTLKCLMTPYKAVTKLAFEDYFDKVNGGRPSASYQICAKIDKVHEALLSSTYNKKGHKAVIGLYNEIEENSNTTQTNLF